MFRSALALKIGLLIVVVLIIGFGVSTILTIQREAALLIEQNKIAARRLTATLVASIEGAMLQERPDVTRTVIQELRQNSPVDAFDVYRRTGMEAFTDLTTAMEIDKNAGLAPDVMSNIKKMARPPGKKADDPLFSRALETVTTQEALETRGHTVLHAADADPQSGEVPGLSRYRSPGEGGRPRRELHGTGLRGGRASPQPPARHRPAHHRRRRRRVDGGDAAYRSAAGRSAGGGRPPRG